MIPILAFFLLVQERDWKAAYAHQAYDEAATKLSAAVEDAAKTPGNEIATVDLLRALAGVYREMGDWARAERVMQRAAGQCAVIEPSGVRIAAITEGLAAIQRAAGEPGPALTNLVVAIGIRQALTQTVPDSPPTDLAADFTALALIHYQTDGAERATNHLLRAVTEWDTAAPGDPRALTAIESLAGAYQERNMYAEAEPLLRRVLRLREAASGAQSSEVISTVDSLAYVEFGLHKFDEAEAAYKRLLNLWIKNAGPDHPMVALTLEKMTELYAFQQRYDDAEKCAEQARALRTKEFLADLQQSGRILIMQAKLTEAEDLYRRAIQIGDLAHATDEALDPLLVLYAKILREAKRPEEAAAVEARMNEARDRKADREGRRPKPTPKPN